MNIGGTYTHMLGRLDLQSALCIGAMIDANIVTFSRQMLVGHSFPGATDIHELHLRRR